jgi:hypothetical protein
MLAWSQVVATDSQVQRQMGAFPRRCGKVHKVTEHDIYIFGVVGTVTSDVGRHTVNGQYGKVGVDAGHGRDHHVDMSLFPDQPPPAAPPAKSKLTPEERRARYADRLITIRLRMLIFRELDARDITTPAAIGAALGMLAAEATKLLRGHQWREGDVARLQAAAARLGVPVPGL